MEEDEAIVERAAEIWDGFCKQFMAMNSGVRFASVESPEDLQKMYRARYEEMIRSGWATPADLPDGIERDEYDADALHIAGWSGDQMMIIGRLVFPSPHRPLPTEAIYDIEMQPPQKVVDGGRAIRLQADSDGKEHALFFGLMSFAWQLVRERGYCRVCFAIAEPIVKLYQKVGVHVRVLGEPRLYAGEMRYPCQYDLVKTVESFTKQKISSS